MIFASLVAALLIPSPGLPIQPRTSLFDQLGIKYTGLNGMEDYLVAADLAALPDNRRLTDFFSILSYKRTAPQAFQNWLAQNGYPEGLHEKSTHLDACIQASTRFQPIQKAIQEGNRKPLSSLRKPPFTMNTSLPELSGYRQASRVGLYAIYADFARGDSHLAVTKVEDIVAFGERLAHDTLIEALVGLAVEATAINAIELHLNKFSIGDLKRLRDMAKKWTTGPMTIESAIVKELEFSKTLIGDAKSAKDFDLLWIGGEDPQMPEEFKAALEKHPFPQVQSALKEALVAFHSEIQNAMKRPEGERENALRAAEAGAKPGVTPETLNELAHMLVRYLGPQYTQLHSSALRRRTQLRLLALHSYVLEYQWNWIRLPDKLEECVPKELLFDPYANKTFVYQKLDETRYELYSEGTEVSGRINLSRPTPRETGGSPESP